MSLDERIADWKNKYGDVFAIGNDYIFRPLQVGEHRELFNHKEWSVVEGEDFIVKTTLLNPYFEELESQAGLISSLAAEVLNLSGYGTDISIARKAMDEAREWANQVTNLMKAFIIAGMPSYTDESLDCYTFSQLARKVAMAENIVNVSQGGNVLELIDPDEEAAKEKARIDKELQHKKPGQATDFDPIAQKLKQALG